MRGLLALCGVLAACGAPERNVAPAPERGTPSSSTTAASRPSSAVASAAAPDALGAPPTADFAGAFAGNPPELCFGDLLDLGRIRECQCRNQYPALPNGSIRSGAYCERNFYGQDLRSAIRVDLSAKPVRARSNATITLELSLENLLEQPVAVLFGRPIVKSLGPIYPTVTVRDERGEDVTFAGDCRQGMSGYGGDYLVGIRGRGRGRFVMDWPAQRIVSVMGRPGEHGCKISREPFPPGKYTLSIFVPFERTLTVPAGADVVSTTVEILPP
jgi:hypothetical protein